MLAGQIRKKKNKKIKKFYGRKRERQHEKEKDNTKRRKKVYNFITPVNTL